MAILQIEMEFYIVYSPNRTKVLHGLTSEKRCDLTRVILVKNVQVCVLYLHEQGILTCLSSFIMVSACMRCREALYSGVMMFSVIREAISCEVRGSVLYDILVTL